jgi:hypothetical protein
MAAILLQPIQNVESDLSARAFTTKLSGKSLRLHQ